MAPGIPAAMERPHFIGIGGAGMSGIAKILARRGAKVAGSDAKESGTAEALRALGATVHIGHAAGHLADDATCVVVSSAIRADNPELAARRRAVDPRRAPLGRARLADAGPARHRRRRHPRQDDHHVDAGRRPLRAGPRPVVRHRRRPGRAPAPTRTHGEGDIFVAEADESDRSFQKYDPEVAIVLNVELDHHANYASMDEIYDSFETFVGKIVPGGTLVVSADQSGAVELTRRVRDLSSLNIVTYGESETADVRVHKITPRGLTSEVTVVLNGKFLTFTVSVPGSHYAHNAVAALAAGVALGIPAHNLASALGKYTGVKRRLQLKGEAAGVQVIDSYAHHPTEMTADLEAMRGAAADSRLLVVFQPHLFSRTQELGTEMGQALALADASVVLDIYPAREDPIPGVTSALIIDAAQAAGADVTAVHDKAAVPEVIAGMAKPGDLVLTMGAGDVTDLGPQILDRLSS